MAEVIGLFVFKAFLGGFIGMIPAEEIRVRSLRPNSFGINKQMGIFMIILQTVSRGILFISVLITLLTSALMLFASFWFGFMTGLPVAVGFVIGIVSTREKLVLHYRKLTEKIID